MKKTPLSTKKKKLQKIFERKTFKDTVSWHYRQLQINTFISLRDLCSTDYSWELKNVKWRKHNGPNWEILNMFGGTTCYKKVTIHGFIWLCSGRTDCFRVNAFQRGHLRSRPTDRVVKGCARLFSQWCLNSHARQHDTVKRSAVPPLFITGRFYHLLFNGFLQKGTKFHRKSLSSRKALFCLLSCRTPRSKKVISSSERRSNAR